MIAKTLAIVAVVFLCGCMGFSGNAPVLAPQGFIYESTRVPLMHEKNTGEAKGTLQSGSAHTKHISIWPISPVISFTWEDESLRQAMNNGGINELHHADIEHVNIIGIYREQRVIAYGTR
ncbi:MAG: TRL domain-containing protein [Sumerlaeia bacterium]